MERRLIKGLKVKLKEIRNSYQGTLLGVTGGIATGKSVVADMLSELGAPIIDYDLLARNIVRPGEAAWKDIVGYFGPHVLEKDDSLNRAALSAIVFNDPDKRKVLENFTHPRIHQAFVQNLSEIASSRPKAVVQAVVPLLIEVNLQELFHKILVVYASPEIQLKRLTLRDGINEEDALKRLRSQTPIEEKLKHADFVINNEGSLDSARKQAEELARKLNVSPRMKT